jgi:hypothetical protein
MAEAASAAAARADQLEGDLAASEATHRTRQEALRQQVGVCLRRSGCCVGCMLYWAMLHQELMLKQNT